MRQLDPGLYALADEILTSLVVFIVVYRCRDTLCRGTDAVEQPTFTPHHRRD